LKGRVNKALLAKLTAANKGSYFCWDAELTGFGVRPHHALNMKPPVPETLLEKTKISGTEKWG